MCTAITYKTKDFYFGRTLDYEFSYGDELVIMPEHYPIHFRHGTVSDNHYAIVGMAHVENDYPLFYDAINEKGVGMAGLNFVGNAEYGEVVEGAINVAQYEFIPWILSQCDSVEAAQKMILNMNLAGTAFSRKLGPSPLHWIIADETKAITVECVKDGIHVYDNPVGVLTNNPPFPVQMMWLNNYMALSNSSPNTFFSDKIDFNIYSRGMGALGLPGDLSSASRFVRAAFTKLNSVAEEDEMKSVGQFFHIMESISQTRGCCRLDNDKYEITIYTSCCNATKGIYYYTTYDNRRIMAVDMHKTDLKGSELVKYPLINEEKIFYQN